MDYKYTNIKYFNLKKIIIFKTGIQHGIHKKEEKFHKSTFQ